MKATYILLIGMGGCLLSACGTYKPYERPSMETEGLYRHAVEEADTTGIARIPWREFFGDPSLQSLIGEALERNTDLRIARTRVEAAEAVLLNARLSYLPSLSVSAEGGFSRTEGGTTAKTYNISAPASWEIDLSGRVTAAKRGARAALEASHAYRQAVQTSLIAAVAESYYTLLSLDRQLDISLRTIASWRETERTLESLKQAGSSDDAAVLQARASRLALEASAESLRQSITETENGLSALLGTMPRTISRGILEQQTFPDRISAGLPVSLLANRPDIRQAEMQLAEAYYATQSARTAFYPSLTLSGAAGWTNNQGGIVTNPASWLLNAAGSLVQPLFNRGTNIANLRRAKAAQEEALLLFQQAVLDAGTEVNNALARLQSARTRLSIEAQQVAALREAVRKTSLLMHHSPTNYLEVLTARQSLLSAELVQAQDKFEEIQGVIDLYRATGGGSE